MWAGEAIAAIAMTEPGAGSDLQGITTTAVRDGESWVINGSKVFISNGQLCDLVVVVAKTDLQAKRAAHGLSLFLVDAGTAGFQKGKNLKKMGFKAQDTSELFFEDCRVPASALLGEVNKGFYYLMTELPQERLLLGAMGGPAAASALRRQQAAGVPTHAWPGLARVQRRMQKPCTSGREPTSRTARPSAPSWPTSRPSGTR